MNPTAYAVRMMYKTPTYPNGRKPWDGFGGFRSRLFTAGIIPTKTSEIPPEWLAAYRAACGR